MKKILIGLLSIVMLFSMVACSTSKEVIKSSSIDAGKKNLPYVSEELHKIKPANMEKIREINESSRKKFKELAQNKFGKDIELVKSKIEEKMKEVKQEEEKEEENSEYNEALDADVLETPINSYTSSQQNPYT